MVSNLYNNIASSIIKFSKKTETIRRSFPRIGRNAECFCGSGLKYKKCCLKFERFLDINV